MSPTTRSDSIKKKVQNREAYSRSAKRRLDNDFETTTSDALTGLNKVAKRATKNTNKAVPIKSQKRKHFNVGINTPKITNKPKESEHVIVSDDDFQSNQFMQKKKKRSGIKIGIDRGKFPRETLAVKKLDRGALTEKEILTIKWVKENYKSPFKLIDHKDFVPKQASGSLDCGVNVMHYMHLLAYELFLNNPFDETATQVFRAELIKRFAKSSKNWRPVR